MTDFYGQESSGMYGENLDNKGYPTAPAGGQWESHQEKDNVYNKPSIEEMKANQTYSYDGGQRGRGRGGYRGGFPPQAGPGWRGGYRGGRGGGFRGGYQQNGGGYHGGRGGGRGGYQQNGGQAEFRQLQDTVYITGLPENTSNEDLINHFSVCGEVKKNPSTDEACVFIFLERSTQKPTGAGSVAFVDKNSAQSAVDNLNGSKLNGSELKVEYQKKRVKNRYPSRGGGWGYPRGGYNGYGNGYGYPAPYGGGYSDGYDYYGGYSPRYQAGY